MKTTTILLICFYSIFGAINAQTNCELENQRCADLGNGYYQNPILGGDYPDPSLFRDGEDYYMTHSSFLYYPGLLIWHSKDLVNWKPVSHALHTFVGSVYAPDLIKHKNKYYIYFPANKTNWVVTADSPEGPWSEPVDLKVPHIDPGHVVDENGKRFLHLSDGNVVQLSEDGLSVIDELKQEVYKGWPIPDTMNVECFCLEAPKLTKRGDYYYLTVAQGGTAGPATSHMVISSRSKTPEGPWEHSPYNPIVFTASKAEKWWSKGHGSLVEDIEGKYWLMYHGYENGFRSLGRQTLMEPMEWTDDGWYKSAVDRKMDQPIKKPKGENIGSGLKLSDNFDSGKLNLQWQFFKDYDPSRLGFHDGKITIASKSNGLANSSPILCIPVNRSYEITAEVEIKDGATGGLTLYYNENANCGIGFDNNSVYVIRHGRALTVAPNDFGTKAHLKIINNEHELMFFYSPDGKTWKKANKSIEVSGYNHNAFHDFLSLRTGLFSFWKGKTTFDNFEYKGIK